MDFKPINNIESEYEIDPVFKLNEDIKALEDIKSSLIGKHGMVRRERVLIQTKINFLKKQLPNKADVFEW